MSLVSVVIPAYNAAETIAGTIASVQAQTHPDWEIVAVEDGSTDATAAVLQGLAATDARIRVVRQANQGQAIARNKGMALARGEYVAFLDADDCWTPDKLARQLAALAAHPDAAAAYSWTDYVSETGEFLHQGSYLAPATRVLETLLVVNFIENGSNLVVRRSAIATVGEFDPDLVPSEDWDYWLRLAARFPLVAVPVVGVRYRVVPSSQSTNVLRLERSCRGCLDRALARHPELAPLAPLAYANTYKYLTYKCLEGAIADPRPRSRLALAGRLIRAILHYDPDFRRQRVLGRLVLRGIAIALVPRSHLVRLCDPATRLGRWLNIDPLLGHIHRPTPTELNHYLRQNTGGDRPS
jgi:glycosyltransferase involved in cell wall biosynthesis